MATGTRNSKAPGELTDLLRRYDSDVQSVVAIVNNTALHASDAAQWRSQLEAAFNVDHFLKYLAVNNAIVSWDAYGEIAHNYYLFNRSSQKLTWIPWDQNLSF